MISRERERVRDIDYYDQLVARSKAERERQYTGQIVLRGEDRDWTPTRQAVVKFYLWPSLYSGNPPESAVDGWIVFVQNIKKHSGKHRHQGGLVIYVLEGEGYTVVDGERHDWEAGDLLLLPLKPGGVEHQHFNKDESKPAKWIAFINSSIKEWGASEMVQVEQHPEYQVLHEQARRRANRR
jgi:mannose-6-phosphate isomerase-like protein (cupin superfamily)